MDPHRLREKETRTIIPSKVKELLGVYAEETDVCQFWIRFKAKIGHFIRSLEKQQRREKKALKRHLYRTLTYLKEEMDLGQSIWQEYYEIKQQIRQIEEKEFETFKIKNRLQELEGSRLITLSEKVKAQAKRNENRIGKVRTENGGTTSDQTRILNETASFYRVLYKKPPVGNTTENCFGDFQSRYQVTEEENAQIGEEITRHEVEKVISGLKNGVSAGMDGLSYDFYKLTWSEIGEFLIKVLNEFGSRGYPESELSVISMLHKGGPREDLRKWRPISLINCEIRICTKV